MVHNCNATPCSHRVTINNIAHIEVTEMCCFYSLIAVGALSSLCHWKPGDFSPNKSWIFVYLQQLMQTSKSTFFKRQTKKNFQVRSKKIIHIIEFGTLVLMISDFFSAEKTTSLILILTDINSTEEKYKQTKAARCPVVDSSPAVFPTSRSSTAQQNNLKTMFSEIKYCFRLFIIMLQ